VGTGGEGERTNEGSSAHYQNYKTGPCPVQKFGYAHAGNAERRGGKGLEVRWGPKKDPADKTMGKNEEAKSSQTHRGVVCTKLDE